MREVAVVTDSTSDLPAEWLEQYAIDVVPLLVVIDGVSYPDGTFTQEEYFRKMAESPKLPTTSQAPVGVFVEAYEKALERARHVVAVHISSKLSGTFEAAHEAARQIGDRVTAFDSMSLSGGLGLVVMAAAKAASAGQSLAEVVAAAERARDEGRLIVGLDSLNNLAKGGRIGKVAKLAGGMLNVKPVFKVTDGTFEPLARMRGAQAQMTQMLDWVTDEMAGRTGGTFTVLHAMALERAKTLREAIEERFAPDEITTQEAGTVISTHTGSGIGVAFLPGG